MGAVIALALALLGDNPSAGPAAALIALFGLLVLVGAVAVATTRPTLSERSGRVARTDTAGTLCPTVVRPTGSSTGSTGRTGGAPGTDVVPTARAPDHAVGLRAPRA